MLYGIRDQGSSLRIMSESEYGYADIFLLKQAVQRITIIRGDKIRLVTGDPLKDITLPYGSIVQPETETIHELAIIILAWIKDCVCCGEDPPV